MKRTHQFAAGITLTISLMTASAQAACVNKYVYRQEKMKVNLTLLTGNLTFQEAKELAAAINSKKAPPMEWVDARGKTIVRHSGDVVAIRPMPVGCGDKKSGAVITATFLRSVAPSGRLMVKLAPDLIVGFDEQKQ